MQQPFKHAQRTREGTRNCTTALLRMPRAVLLPIWHQPLPENLGALQDFPPAFVPGLGLPSAEAWPRKDGAPKSGAAIVHEDLPSDKNLGRAIPCMRRIWSQQAGAGKTITVTSNTEGVQDHTFLGPDLATVSKNRLIWPIGWSPELGCFGARPEAKRRNDIGRRQLHPSKKASKITLFWVPIWRQFRRIG